MPLPSTYADPNCSMTRALEVVGERWTLLIVRDAFYGARRFGEFAAHLGIPRAVLTTRLKALVQEGVLTRTGDAEYRLTDKGIELWPVVRALVTWGDTHYSPDGERRLFRHDADGGRLAPDGRCRECGEVIAVPDIRIEPGPGFHPAAEESPIDAPKRLLTPIDRA
jgi:DNA-binding HxlR family transcriptional regulator